MLNIIIANKPFEIEMTSKLAPIAHANLFELIYTQTIPISWLGFEQLLPVQTTYFILKYEIHLSIN